MERFSSYVEKTLLRSGWHEGRRIDIAEAVRFLEKSGFTVFDCVKSFLAEFGGLVLYETPHPGNRLSSGKEITFDVVAANGILRENVLVDEDELGISLCPVGEADWAFTTILMSEKGHVFVAPSSTSIYLCGMDVEEALNRLLQFDSQYEIDGKWVPPSST